MKPLFKVTYQGRSWNRMLTNPKYSLLYKVGTTTFPVVGRIFVFEHPYNVESFLTRDTKNDNVIIFEGVGTDPQKIESAACEQEQIELFWKGGVSIDETYYYTYLTVTSTIAVGYVPQGTLVVKDFTPSKQYSYWRFREKIDEENVAFRSEKLVKEINNE